jgi:hypothetical protein
MSTLRACVASTGPGAVPDLALGGRGGRPGPPILRGPRRLLKKMLLHLQYHATPQSTAVVLTTIKDSELAFN